MSDDPVRLRDPSSTEPPLVRDVLGAGDDFGPTQEGLDRVAARLAVVLPPGTFPKPAVAPHGVAPLVKLIAGLGVVAAVGGGVWLGTTTDAPSSAPVASVAAPRPPDPSSTTPWTELPPLAPAPSASTTSRPRLAPPPPPRPPEPPPMPSSMAPPVVEAPPSESESSMINRAQRALAQRAPADALAITALHARGYPQGVFTEERERIAIEALVRLGRIDEARARRDQFLRAYPRTAYRERVDSLFKADAAR